MKLYRVETVVVSYVVAETKDQAGRIARRDAVGNDYPTRQLVTESTQKSIVDDEWSNAEPWPSNMNNPVEWYCEQLNKE